MTCRVGARVSRRESFVLEKTYQANIKERQGTGIGSTDVVAGEIMERSLPYPTKNYSNQETTIAVMQFMYGKSPYQLMTQHVIPGFI